MRTMKGAVFFACLFASALSATYEIGAEGFLSCHKTIMRNHAVQLYVRHGNSRWNDDLITEVRTDRYGYFNVGAKFSEPRGTIKPFLWIAADQTKQATPKTCFSHFLYNVFYNVPKNMYWHEYQIDICACRYHDGHQSKDIKGYKQS